MGLMNGIGAGLSAMGGAIAQQAGTEALNQQKAELESAQATLVSQLQGEREHAGRVETGQIQSGLQVQAGQIQSGIVGQQTASSEKIASGEQGTQLAVAKVGAGAQLEAVKEQIAAQGWTTQFDKDTGAPIRVNGITGETKPLTDQNGKPLSVINTALVPTVQATVNSNNEQMRAENQTYTPQINSLTKQYDDMGQDMVLRLNQDKLTAARAPIKREIDQLTSQHNMVMDSLRQSSAQALSALSTTGATTKDVPPPPNPQMPTGGQGNNAPAPAAKNTALDQPAGGGTKASPYKPTSQAQIDWLKSNGVGAFYSRPGDATVYQVGGAAPAGQ